ncbi:phage-specific integrase [mine drainage metagenome]|uniref:Phage-specific integrase n=1 Tax=mine drainage metagenome TaxID=410659 RepID=T0Y437_9ZZZZ
MSEFILLKRTVGNKYDSEVGVLKRFDRYLGKNYPTITGLPKEAVTGWCAKQPHEKPANQCSRASVIRQFAKYLDNTGHKAFVLPDNYYPSGPQYVPHIYTQDELQRFFAETDRCHFCYECPWRHLVMPVFFRLLFECGLRCSEARLLTVGDVDLDKGCLTVLESKNRNSRLVMVSTSMLKRLREYADAVHTFPDESAFFFSGSPGKPMTLGNVYKNFRRFLWQARIPHTGAGPRVHDLRHAFAVYRLKAWSEEGKDLMAMLPVLKTYMGHNSFNETAYYLRMTADVFPDIRMKLEGTFGDIIPDLGGELYEAN